MVKLFLSFGVILMEWIVTGIIKQAERNADQILKVCAESKLNFIIWVRSNITISTGCTLTPVIDGYIANHNKSQFVTIKKVTVYTPAAWQELIKTPSPLSLFFHQTR